MLLLSLFILELFFLHNAVIIVTLLGDNSGNMESWPGQMHVKCCGCLLCELIPARRRREPLFCALMSGDRQRSSSAPSADAAAALVRAEVQVRAATVGDAKFSSETNGNWRDDAQI